MEVRIGAGPGDILIVRAHAEPKPSREPTLFLVNAGFWPSFKKEKLGPSR